MSRAGIETLLYMMDMAFEGDPELPRRNWHALIVNLNSVRDEDWTWLPEGGKRSIFELVRDVAQCKYVYASCSFGDGSIHWDKPGTLPAIPDGTSPANARAFLFGAQDYWRSKVAALEDDAELLQIRPSPWGDERHETRLMIKTMIEHDIYHAGEINHIRALAQGND